MSHVHATNTAYDLLHDYKKEQQECKKHSPDYWKYEHKIETVNRFLHELEKKVVDV